MLSIPKKYEKHVNLIKKLFGLIVRIAGGVVAWVAAKIPVPEAIEGYAAVPVVATICLAWGVTKLSQKQAWMLIGASFFISIALGAYYFTISGDHVVKTPDGTRHVRGQLRDGIAEKMKQADLTETEFLFASQNNSDVVWTPESVGRTTTIIAFWYGAFVFTFTFGIFASCEELARKETRPQRAATPKAGT